MRNDLPDEPKPSWEGEQAKETGRPTKYNKENVETILKHIEDGSTKTEAAGLRRVHRDTLNEWQNKYPDFLMAIKQAEAKQICNMVMSIYEASKTNWRAAAWLLERRWPEKFSLHRNFIVEQKEKTVYTWTPEKERSLIELCKRLISGSEQKDNVQLTSN